MERAYCAGRHRVGGNVTVCITGGIAFIFFRAGYKPV